MALTNRKALKAAAYEILEQNRDAAKRTVLLYAGVAAVFSFGIQLLTGLLGNMMENTSGIGSFQTRATLDTVQSVLDLSGSILPTFWSMGYIYAMLQFVRKHTVEDKTMLQGFRNFGPVLRLMLLEYLLYFGVTMAGMIVGATVLSFTPLVNPMIEAAMPYVGVSVLDEQAQMEIMEASMPFAVCCLLICLVFLIPMMYRLMMAKYVLMENPEYGAIQAISRSFRMTRRHCFKLFCLELSFWWYYLAHLAAAMAVSGNLILALLGVQLPVSADAQVLIFSGIALAAQFGVQYKAANKVELTFVQAYLELKQEAFPPVIPALQNQPWQEPFV